MLDENHLNSDSCVLNASRAEALLAKIEACEDLAEICDSEESETLRKRFAAQYERVIGVEPQHRRQLRERLELIRQKNEREIERILKSMD